ncbi:DUF7527 domain-containing protein [Haloarcula litorea]|uniref:DUF7527 domain-containing protein n=1 Tax=Haloarcula litorea TaxID=3032579 RepID=UPI0023E7D396|nr:hypothetical protein [Halomicroarcula sp. GDY20]
MTTRTVELIPDWDTVPFDGGYAGLQALADREFSGAVVSGPTRLCMLNGTVVGVLDGDIEDFESGDGTARAAPHEALPLLAVMQERADEVRAKYYTQDTPIEDVDRTLTDGNFTGFVELSENVLSGDYYLVYHQGRSMSVAWVGSAERLITDDEAFEQANDEVGIYEVKPGEISPVEIPEPEAEDPASDEAAAGGVAATDDPAADEPTEETGEVTGSEPDPTQAATDDTTSADTAADEAATDTAADETAPETATSGDGETDRPRGDRRSGGPPGSKAVGGRQEAAGSERSRSTDRDVPDDEDAPSDTGDTGTTRDTTASQSDRAEGRTDAAARTDSERAAATTETRERGAEPTADRSSQRTGESGTASAAETPTGQARSATNGTADASSETSPADLETRSVPSLDPERSVQDSEPVPGTASTGQSVSSAGSQSRSGATDGRADEQFSREREERAATPDPAEREGGRQSADGSSESERAGDTAAELDEREREVERLTDELEEREAELDRLEDELADVEATNEELRTERDRLQSELEEARAEIQQLRDRLEDAEDEDTPDVGTRLSPREAIDGTNLFVRYDSKGEATLAQAHDGDADRSDVEPNLRLEYHTQFDGTDAAVDGTPFEAFLRESIQYRFVDWLVRNLLYEIRDTGHAGEMQDLYDAIPEIDRAELNGSVSVTYTEDGDEHRTQEQFDVVVRDRMGNPLVVANINDSRQPASESQMTDIVRDAERVGNASESLAAAFLVTSSFFEPGALETAEDATASGLLSRDKRKSFVNLSRKDGYHLCLLEARNQEFHLAVPEL